METPISNFVQKYSGSNTTRFHMPGHKGQGPLGCETLDITEIQGADVLCQAQGIIGESQDNAAWLFGAGKTYYSTEGSSLSIKSMLAAAYFAWKKKNHCGSPWVLAARNIHRSMVDACALLNLNILFLEDEASRSICTCNTTPELVQKALDTAEQPPVGVYLTSPDYLGNIADIKGIAAVCNRREVPLLVDNAHGAYLAFLQPSLHPMALGAAMCCDSGHKTLPVLTPGAYLHVAKPFVGQFCPYVNKAMTLFGSTSPSYLVMQSLDLCNKYLAEKFGQELRECIEKIDAAKKSMGQLGIPLVSGEKLKVVISAWENGYTGESIAAELRDYNIECEYADDQFVVLMMTPQNKAEDWKRLYCWMEKTCLVTNPQPSVSWEPVFTEPGERVMSIRDAVFSQGETISVNQALGRVLAMETVSCPPAIPIAVSGEKITEKMIQEFKKYRINQVTVVADNENLRK